MMNFKGNNFFYKAVNILFLNNPVKTSIGILVGIVSDAFFPLFFPVVIGVVKLYHYIAGGILLINLKSFFALAFAKAKRDENIDKAFDLIREIKKKTKVPQYKIDEMYLKVVTNYVEATTLKENLQKKLDLLQKQLSAEQKNIA